MAKDDKALSKNNGTDMTTAGTFMPDDFAQFIAGQGFASIKTVMLGDPKDGKLPFYIGRLIGPGASVKINDGESEQPTWSFNPLVRLESGGIGFAENITHIIPASYMVHAACSRIFDKCERNKEVATVGVKFNGKGTTKKGRALNDYDIFEKYDARR